MKEIKTQYYLFPQELKQYSLLLQRTMMSGPPE